MLEMRPDCERCGIDLPADATGAHICSFECTFCTSCTDAMAAICPNCGGALMARPLRSGAALQRYPASLERKFQA